MEKHLLLTFRKKAQQNITANMFGQYRFIPTSKEIFNIVGSPKFTSSIAILSR